jgi:hypothetical protein
MNHRIKTIRPNAPHRAPASVLSAPSACPATAATVNNSPLFSSHPCESGSIRGSSLPSKSIAPSDFSQSAIGNPQSAISMRPYQQAAFQSTAGIELWLWARQTGKSHTLAAWAIHRLLTRPGRLVTILSNSKQNGIELNRKIADLWHQLTTPQMQNAQCSMHTAQSPPSQIPSSSDSVSSASPPTAAMVNNSAPPSPIPQSALHFAKRTSDMGNHIEGLGKPICNPQFIQLDLSPDTRFESFNTETRITLPALASFTQSEVPPSHPSSLPSFPSVKNSPSASSPSSVPSVSSVVNHSSSSSPNRQSAIRIPQSLWACFDKTDREVGALG